MSWNSSGSCDADSMTKVPVRSIRSIRPWRNSTLLIRASGMSMPARVSTPWRNITRRSVMTKCVVHHMRNGHNVSQPTSTSQMAAITPLTTFLAVWLQSVWLTKPMPNAATPLATMSTSTAGMSRFQCGCRCSTTCSSTARTFSGYPTV